MWWSEQIRKLIFDHSFLLKTKEELYFKKTGFSFLKVWVVQQTEDSCHSREFTDR